MSDDWRDPKRYPDPEDTSLHRWAWEFPRRNPKFRAEVEQAEKEQHALEEKGDLRVPWNLEPVGAVFVRWGVKFVLLGDWKGIGEAPIRFDAAPRFADTTGGQTWAQKADPERPDRLALEFDLDAPIEPQIARARNTLLEYPDFRRGRNQTDKYPGYLRVLDATDAGATPKQIADKPAETYSEFDERTLRDWLRKAWALRDGGYLKLVEQ